MNRLWLAVVLVSFGGLAVPSMGQAPAAAPATSPNGSTLPAPAPIPAAVRSSTSPQTARGQIEAFITGHLARLKSSDARTLVSARDSLAAEMTTAGASSDYKDVYAESLGKKLEALAADPDFRVRLQAGVLAAKVAAAAENDRMANVAVKLLADSNPAVALWGVKTARSVVANQVQLANFGSSPVPGAIAKAVAAHPKDGAIVRDAYDALGLDIDKLGKLKAAAISQLAPHVLAIMQARSGVYKVEFPSDADADRSAATFFSNSAFKILPQPQKVAAAQEIVNLLMLSAGPAVNATDTGMQKAMIDQAMAIGRNLWVIADDLDKAAPTAETKAFKEATQKFRSVSAGMTPQAADVNTMANDALNTLRAVAGYSSIQPPAMPAPATNTP